MSSTTTTSAAATSSTDSDGDGGAGSFLGSGGSTLILAFLAIGLFAGGLLVMFTMRRYVNVNRRRVRAWRAADRPWGWDEAALGPPPTLLMSMNVQMRRFRDFGKKPELWDVSAAVSSEGNWENVMPIAAKPLYEGALLSSEHESANSAVRTQSPSAPSSTSPARAPGCFHPFRVGLRDTRTQIANLRGPWPRQNSSSDASPPHTLSPSSPMRTDNASESPDTVGRAPACVEVALTIAMPGQVPCAQGRVPLFALGVTSVRWRGGPLAPTSREEDTTGSSLSQSSSSRYPHTDTDDTSRGS